MSLITRTYSFTDGTTAYGSQVESEIANIVNVLNNLDAASTTWDIVKAVNGAATPLIADNSTGANSVFEARVNGVAKVSVSGTGVLTTVNGITNSGAAIAAGTQKITGLSNGTAATDAAAYGQLKVLQTVIATNSQSTSTSAAAFTNTNLAATITPTSASSNILICFSYVIALAAASGATAYFTIKRGVTNIGDSSVGLARFVNPAAATMYISGGQAYYDSPATTSSTTYTISLSGDGANNVVWNNNSIAMHITLLEIQ